MVMADASAPRDGGDSRLAAFADPLAGWHNDDILLDKDARQALGAVQPQLLRVLDWPELRALFKQHEGPANQHVRRGRQLGLMAGGCGVLALAVAAVALLVPQGASVVVGAVALALAAVAGALFAARRLVTRSTELWLGSRYWTERARGLYFQVLINNLDQAVAAMTDNTALAGWKATRARALEALPPARDMADRVRALARDVSDDEVWILPEWREPPPPPTPSPDLDRLLERLRAQRFDVQIAYSRRKLGESMGAPRRRAEANAALAKVAMVVAAVAGGGAGLALLLGHGPETLVTRAAAAVALAAVGVVLGLRALNDALYPSAELVRFAGYNAAAVQARAQFDGGGLDAKIDALRAMEAHAYRDLRDFIASHARD